VMGAGRVVTDTLTAFARDPIGFDKVGIEYQKKVEAPLPPGLEPKPSAYFENISGEKPADA
jgi:hypothetical protein